MTRPAAPPRSILHHITSKHATYIRDGVGEIIVCSPRFSSKARLWFQPQLVGEGWHQIPLRSSQDSWMQMLRAETPQQAMTVLRHLQNQPR